jgi:flagellar biosynthesis protein FlhB
MEIIKKKIILKINKFLSPKKIINMIKLINKIFNFIINNNYRKVLKVSKLLHKNNYNPPTNINHLNSNMKILPIKCILILVTVYHK